MNKTIKSLSLIALALIFSSSLSAKDEWVIDSEKATETHILSQT